jgi:hypothetical protein
VQPQAVPKAIPQALTIMGLLAGIVLAAPPMVAASVEIRAVAHLLGAGLSALR